MLIPQLKKQVRYIKMKLEENQRGSGYSYAKLGVRYPSAGGIVEYLAQSYGSGYTTGVLSIILYFSVTIVMAMVARAFGSYAAALVSCQNSVMCVNIFSSAVVVVLTSINFMGSNIVGKVEKFIVIIKITILAVFVVAGIWLLNPALLSLKNGGATPMGALSTVAICLLAYHGFGVITNTVEDMPNPPKTLPKSIYGAIGIVMIIYVGAALAVFGNLPLAEIIRAKDYAMAEAAKPIFGQWGFTIVAVTALLSAASSINANLYSTTNMTYLLAKDGELPEFEKRKLWRAGTGGLLLTTVLILFIANFLNLTRIASLGSLVYLVVYSAVHLGHLKSLTKETGASKTIILFAFLTNFIVFIIFVFQTAEKNPIVIYLLIGFIFISLLIEVYMQQVRNRSIQTMIKTRIKSFRGKTANEIGK
ncbi:hypothetical protein B1H10_01170 [candidate division KSB1 bacterium 4484_188]|nr:MAG: hypothetical protein B1H10_01170 [candidate division KSB1 bacterium 4484_188]